MNYETCKQGEIIGVSVIDLKTHVDDRGMLAELARIDWPEVSSIISPPDSKVTDLIFRQVYTVINHDSAIRAFHCHERLVDFFTLVHGFAKFVLLDVRKDSKTFGNYQVINVCDKKLQTVCVPAGVQHGWRGSANSILTCVANHLYKGWDSKGHLDETRIPWNSLGEDIWQVQFK